MRIGLVIYGDLNTLSGGYLYDRILVEYLRQNGDQVEVVSVPYRTYLQHLADNLSKNLFDRLATLEIDLLLQDELTHPTLFGMNRRLRLQAAYPVVSIVHHLRCSESGHPPIVSIIYRIIERAYLNTLDGLVYNSRTTRRAVKVLAGDGRPSVVAFPGSDRLSPEIEDGFITRRAGEAGPLRLLFLGNLIPRKGLHVLLEALARLSPGSWKLTVVGNQEMDRGYAGRMLTRAGSWVEDGMVTFTGPLDQQRLRDAYLGHQVLVVPSLYEGYGIVFGEGMGFGIPAIGTNSGAVGEIVRDGMDGFLVPAGEAGPLAAVLGRLAEDRILLSEMALAARRRYEALPTWEMMGRAIRRFFLALGGGQYNNHEARPAGLLRE